MRQKPVQESAEEVIKCIRRATRRHFSAEDKIGIVLEGLGGEASIAELLPPRRHCPEPLLSLVEGIPRGGEEATRWRYRSGGDTDEVKELRREASALKEGVAELTLGGFGRPSS